LLKHLDDVFFPYGVWTKHSYGVEVSKIFLWDISSSNLLANIPRVNDVDEEFTWVCGFPGSMGIGKNWWVV